MEKEIEQLRIVENRFANRKQLAAKTTATLIAKAREEANVEIGDMNHRVDLERQRLNAEAMARAEKQGEQIQLEEARKQEALIKAYEQRKEALKRHLIEEVFTIGHR